MGLAWITAIMSKWEKITLTIVHQKKNPGTEESWKMAQILAATHKNTTTPEELYGQTLKYLSTCTRLCCNFLVSIARICVSLSRLATNLAWMIAQQTDLCCFCNSPALTRWPTKHQFILLSKVFFKHTVIQSFPVVTHLSILSVWAPRYFHDKATSSLHRDFFSSQCSLHIFLLFPC